MSIRFSNEIHWSKKDGLSTKHKKVTEAVSQEQEVVNPWRWRATSRHKRKGGSAGF